MPVWIIIALVAVIGGGAVATVSLLPDDEATPEIEQTESRTTTDEDTAVTTPNSNGDDEAVADVAVTTNVDTADKIQSIEDDLDTLVFDDLDAEIEDMDFELDLASDIDFGAGL